MRDFVPLHFGCHVSLDQYTREGVAACAVAGRRIAHATYVYQTWWLSPLPSPDLVAVAFAFPPLLTHAGPTQGIEME